MTAALLIAGPMAAGPVTAGRLTAAPLAAASSGASPLWYATRATGVVAFLLLTATFLAGIAQAEGFAAPGLPRVVTAGLHRNVSLLALAFVGAHVLTTVLDSYTPIGLVAAFVPFSSTYRPFWLSLGAVAFDLLLAIALTSLIRDRMSYQAWRAVHWLAYASWPVALWHALGTGTDSRLPWLLALDALCVASIAAAVCWRLSRARPGAARVAGAAATVVLPIVTVVFLAVGPLQPGWARRAGTPAALLGSATGPASGAASAGPAPADVPAAGTTAFTGQVHSSPGPGAGEVTITMTGTAGASPARSLTVVLRGTPEGAGISMSSGTVRLASDGQGAVAQGPVTALNGHHLTATLRGPTGPARQADIFLNISGNQATGQLTVSAAGAS